MTRSTALKRARRIMALDPLRWKVTAGTRCAIVVEHRAGHLVRRELAALFRGETWADTLRLITGGAK